MRTEPQELNRPAYAALDAEDDALAAARASGEDLAPLMDRAARRVGDAWVGELGARWTAEDAVTNLPRLGAHAAEPMRLVREALHRGVPGHLRAETERHDLALRERRLAWLLAHVDEERAGLVEDVAAWSGAPAPALDEVDRFLIAAQQALTALSGRGAPRDAYRRLRERTTLYMGEAFRARLGAGRWSVCADPRDLAFGEFEIWRFAPMNVIGNVRADLPRDMLAYALVDEIDARLGADPDAPAPRDAGHPTYWFALCRKAEAAPIAAVLAHLAPPAGAEAEIDGEALVVSAPDPASDEPVLIIAHLSDDAHVAAEALEFAESHAADRPERARIEASDARYEISWPEAYTASAMASVRAIARAIAVSAPVILTAPQRGLLLDDPDDG